MSSPAVDSYLDELLAELPAAEPALAAASVGVAMPPEPVAAAPAPVAAATRPPAPVPVPTPAPMSVPVPAPASVPMPAPVAAPAPGTSPRIREPVTSRPMPASQRWLRVALARDHYAFELLRVQEVVRMAPIVAMRGADRAVLGVMNLRGRIVPVFDLGRWLGGADVAVGERARIVVVERDDELIGVLVADVEDVASLGREHIEPPLPGTSGAMKDVIVGVARVGRVPTVLLDANALFG